MERISQEVMVHASRAVEGMSHDQKVRLADEIFVQQPSLLASILVLHRMGVSTPELEVALHILLVAFEAMQRSGNTWPSVSEDVQDKCLQRLTARMRFNDGLPARAAAQMVRQFCDEHPERYLLAFAYGYLGEHDLLSVRSDAQKSLLLAVLNLVECIAITARHPASN